MFKTFSVFVILLTVVLGSTAQANSENPDKRDKKEPTEFQKLETFFVKNYNELYNPRFCGRNIAKLLIEAEKAGIDTTGANPISIRGEGFLQTQSFYSRGSKDKHKNLGWQHTILEFEGYIFDFHLAEPVVLKLEEYVRLQLTPPTEPTIIFGLDYTKKGNPDFWNVLVLEQDAFKTGTDVIVKKAALSKIIDMKKVRALDREAISKRIEKKVKK